ncbi:MAG: hypothetical protein JSW51_05760, partial [Gemmatimonadota bacterium]
AIRSGFSTIIYVVRREIERQLRAHVEPIFGDAASLRFVHQSLDNVPPSFSVPAGRTKPWGTAHAILAAEPHVDSPFGVCNADDFYGAKAYGMLARHLSISGSSTQEEPRTPVSSGRGGKDTRNRATDDYALVGYPLENTLSPHGGVSRAVCRCDPTGYLERLEEVTQIEKVDGQLTGIDSRGERVVLQGGETVSMNLWGFAPDLFDRLRRQFLEFLSSYGSSPAEEFLIPTAIGRQLAKGWARLRVLQSSDRWMGMTYSEDSPQFQQKLLELVHRGVYPEDLKLGFPDPQ